jgi:tetratricopeptide (TPR) repeat protein
MRRQHATRRPFAQAPPAVPASAPLAAAPALRRPALARGARAAAASLLTLAIAGLLAYFLLTPIAPFARHVYANEVRRQMVIGGVLLGYAVWLLCTRRLPTAKPGLDLALLALALASTAGVLGSTDRRLSLESALVVAPVLPLSLMLADPRLAPSAAVRRGALLALAVAALFALASVYRQWQEWLALVRAVDPGLGRGATLLPPTMPRVRGVGSHPNVLGAAFAVGLPLALGALADRRWERVLAAASLALVLMALFFTLSRTAWVAALVGAAVTGLGLLPTRRWHRAALALGLSGALVALLIVLFAFATGHARPGWLFRDSLDPRADMRRVGLALFRENPLTGVGPGQYVSRYAEHGGAYPFAAVHSHNLVVQVAAEYGLLGLAAGALALTIGAVTLFHTYRSRTVEGRRAAAVATGALAALLVDGLAESPHLFPEVLLVLAVPLALAVRALPGTSAVAVRPVRKFRRLGSVVRKAVPLLLLAGGLALIPWWWRVDRAAAAHERSTRAATAGRLDEAVAEAGRAAAWDPTFAAYRFQLGAALTARYLERGDPADRAAAIDAYERALRLHPRNGAALVDLAALRLEGGDRAGARAAAEALWPLSRGDPLLQLAYAVIVQRTGDAAEAVETYAGLLALDPTLALTPFWHNDPFRQARYEAIVERALARVAEVTGPGPAAEARRTAIRVLSGRASPDLDTVRAAAADAPDDVALHVALGRLLLAAGQMEEAGTVLRAAAARQPDSADARAALGDWYAAVGRTAAARREWLAAAYLGDVRAGDALGQSFPPGQVPTAVISLQRQLLERTAITRFYLLFQTFRFTFLRHEPVPIITRGDWLDALPIEYPQWQEHLQRWEAERGAR